MSEKELFDAIQEFLALHKVEKKNKPKWYEDFKQALDDDFKCEEISKNTVSFERGNECINITRMENGTYAIDRSSYIKEPFYAEATFSANGISKEDIFEVL